MWAVILLGWRAVWVQRHHSAVYAKLQPPVATSNLFSCRDPPPMAFMEQTRSLSGTAHAHTPYPLNNFCHSFVIQMPLSHRWPCQADSLDWESFPSYSAFHFLSTAIGGNSPPPLQQFNSVCYSFTLQRHSLAWAYILWVAQQQDLSW